jgi:septum formation protein
MLLARAGVRFEVIPADIPEIARVGEEPGAFAERLAGEKALAVAEKLETSAGRWVLGADTIVVLGDEVLGKPTGPAHAVEMLAKLVGRTHRVVTGIALIDVRSNAAHSMRVESDVEMRPAERAELEEYVATGEPLDKAGSYAVQGEGRRFVARIEGSETNVIGLPLTETLDLLRRVGALPSAQASDDG